MSKKAILPFVIFIVVVGFLAAGLKLNPGRIPSPFVGKPAPAFSLPTLFSADKIITNESLIGKVWLLNVWASWCVGCRIEHPLLNQLSELNFVDIVGLNYKDTRTDANNWLLQHGDPYTTIIFDETGDTGIDYGVYGVPETFVIDKVGIVRLKHIGPLAAEDVEQTLVPLVNLLKGESL